MKGRRRADQSAGACGPGLVRNRDAGVDGRAAAASALRVICPFAGGCRQGAVPPHPPVLNPQAGLTGKGLFPKHRHCLLRDGDARITSPFRQQQDGLLGYPALESLESSAIDQLPFGQDRPDKRDRCFFRNLTLRQDDDIATVCTLKTAHDIICKRQPRFRGQSRSPLNQKVDIGIRSRIVSRGRPKKPYPFCVECLCQGRCGNILRKVEPTRGLTDPICLNAFPNQGGGVQFRHIHQSPHETPRQPDKVISHLHDTSGIIAHFQMVYRIGHRQHGTVSYRKIIPDFSRGSDGGSLHSTIIRVQPAQPIRLTTNFQNMSEFAHWNLDQPHGLLEKTIIAKRLDRLEIPLDQTQQSNHELRHTRGTHSLRNWKFWVDHQIHLSGLTALTNQRQSRIRGQIQFPGLPDFKVCHTRFGEE